MSGQGTGRAGRVYLAGPIGGCTYGECTTWRGYARKKLAALGVVGISPMRAKEFLQGEEKLDTRDYEHPLATSKGITTRDRFDTTKNCDILLANLFGAEKPSLGTFIELGWADIMRVPVIVVIEDEGSCMDHKMMQEIAGYRVNDLDAAIGIAVAILKTD